MHPPEPRAGFALPLALMVLVVSAMMISLLLDSGLQELRTARGELASARAAAAVETALAALLTSLVDTSIVSLPRGSAWQTVAISGADTTRVSLQPLGGALCRAVVTSRSWTGSVRADAGAIAFVRVLPDTTAPAQRRLGRLPGYWWTAIP